MAEESETGYHILKVSIVGVEFSATFLKVGLLQRDAGIENKRETVDGRVRSRVGRVHLVMLPEAQGQSVHTAIEARRQVRKYSQPILAIWRVGAALSPARCGKHSQSDDGELFFHWFTNEYVYPSWSFCPYLCGRKHRASAEVNCKSIEKNRN